MPCRLPLGVWPLVLKSACASSHEHAQLAPASRQCRATALIEPMASEWSPPSRIGKRARARARRRSRRGRRDSRPRPRPDGDSRRPEAARGWRAGEVAAVEHLEAVAAASTLDQSATRNASGPMLAPRAAGADVGRRADQADALVHARGRQMSIARSPVSVWGRSKPYSAASTSQASSAVSTKWNSLMSWAADHAGLDQQIEVDQAGPEVAPEEQDRAGAALAGLHERHHLEQFVERAEAAGEAHQRRCCASGSASCAARSSGTGSTARA